MGRVIGGVVGGIGQIVAANKQAEAAERATQAAMTGYNYLTTGAGGAPTQGIIDRGDAAGSQMGALLGLGGDTAGAQQGFDNYLNSTGYQFRLGEGSNAITGNAASRGLLDSGATARGLTELGQNMASAEFGNYLAQLGGVQRSGQNALGQVATAGGAAGSGAASAIIGGGDAQAAGITGAASNFGNAISSGINFFSRPRQQQNSFPAAPGLNSSYTGGVY